MWPPEELRYSTAANDSIPRVPGNQPPSGGGNIYLHSTRSKCT